MPHRIRLRALPVLAALLAGLLGCSRPAPDSISFYAMDTFMTITVYGKNSAAALTAAESRVHELERLLSVTDPDSEISALNACGYADLSPDTAAVLSAALELSRSTGGAFDATIYPVMHAWGFYGDSFTVPTAEQLAAATALTDSRRVSVSGNTFTLGDGQKLDPGGIAKGYAADELVRLFGTYGIDCGIISLGGNVAAFGQKPGGGQWKTAVQNPDGSDDYLGIISLTDVSIVTSGAYRRNFTVDGVTYHHIMDPHTGRPAETDLLSVTVVCTDGSTADALSTALFVMGSDRALDYWREHSGEFDTVLYTRDGSLIITGGLRAAFSSHRNFQVIDIP